MNRPISNKDLNIAVFATILCFSHLRWNFVFQRPQHILTRAAKNTNVYYFEEPLYVGGAVAHLKQQLSPEGVCVVTPILPEGIEGQQATRIMRKLVDGLVSGFAARPTVWYYTPMALPFSRHLSTALVVYDNMDELSAFKNAPARLVALERELFRRADIIFTGGQSLYELKSKLHRNVHAFPSSVDAAHFETARSISAPRSGQEGRLHPQLGFFGVIDERLDTELVARLADLRPDWQLAMIGPVVKIDPANLPQRANIHWLGARKYQDLPACLSRWDVGIMPFAINESTRFISPTKTPEFLAAGLPVVSSRITDVVRPYGEKGLVEIADSADDFVAKVEHVLDRPKVPWLREVDKHLAQLSWDLTWSGMVAQMVKARERRLTSVSTLEAVEPSYV